MSKPLVIVDRNSASEAGYMLIAVLFLAALILLVLATAAPRMAVELQRDKEGELFHRGMQYAGAIRRYYRRFGAYPNTLDQLEKSNNLRFLRRRYKDPITGKDEWRLIRYGQARTGSAGQLGQAATAAGAAGALGTGSAADANSGLGAAGTNGAASGASSAGGSSFSNSGSSFSNSGSSFSNSGSSFSNSGSSFGGGNATGGSAGGFGSTGSTGTDGSGGAGAGSFGSGNNISAPGTNGAGTAAGGPLGSGTASTTFGGGQIIGVSSTSPKESIREFKKQKHYNQWEFLYDPNVDGRTQGSNGTGISTTPGSTSNSPFGNQPNNSFGNQPNNSFGNQPNNSFGSQPNGGSSSPQPVAPGTSTVPPSQ